MGCPPVEGEGRSLQGNKRNHRLELTGEQSGTRNLTINKVCKVSLCNQFVVVLGHLEGKGSTKH